MVDSIVEPFSAPSPSPKVKVVFVVLENWMPMATWASIEALSPARLLSPSLIEPEPVVSLSSTPMVPSPLTLPVTSKSTAWKLALHIGPAGVEGDPVGTFAGACNVAGQGDVEILEQDRAVNAIGVVEADTRDFIRRDRGRTSEADRADIVGELDAGNRAACRQP